jgi:hypothetical protein
MVSVRANAVEPPASRRDLPPERIPAEPPALRRDVPSERSHDPATASSAPEQAPSTRSSPSAAAELQTLRNSKWVSFDSR